MDSKVVTVKAGDFPSIHPYIIVVVNFDRTRYGAILYYRTNSTESQYSQNLFVFPIVTNSETHIGFERLKIFLGRFQKEQICFRVCDNSFSLRYRNSFVRIPSNFFKFDTKKLVKVLLFGILINLDNIVFL
jgi:hypothetical protein